SFIPVYSGRKQQVVEDTYTKQVVEVHCDGVAGDALPNRIISRLLPIQVSQNTLGACTVGMHEIDPTGIPSKEIRINFAKGVWIKTLIKLLRRLVDFFFLGGNSA